MQKLTHEQLVQERQYRYPYHYIPEVVGGQFSQVQSWSWGMQYLGGMELVLSRLEALSFKSLIDVGCGDGRFLREARKRFEGVDLFGVDYSQSAVQIAKAMNPDIEYVCTDISTMSFSGGYYVCTMVEVLEHIKPDSVLSFLESVHGSMNPEGTLILTVPHKNKKLNEKHFQHFTSDTLSRSLESSFDVVSIIPFESLSRVNSRLLKLFGYSGSNYLVTNKKLNTWLYKRILHGCLNQQPEDKCGRLLAIAKPK